MKLVEVVQAESTSDETRDALVELCHTMKKVPVQCKDTPGYVARARVGSEELMTGAQVHRQQAFGAVHAREHTHARARRRFCEGHRHGDEARSWTTDGYVLSLPSPSSLTPFAGPLELSDVRFSSFLSRRVLTRLTVRGTRYPCGHFEGMDGGPRSNGRDLRGAGRSRPDAGEAGERGEEGSQVGRRVLQVCVLLF